ncbi:LacI family DNA-binding transcriptional regulator [Candidatus Haliotispira prima]|uniref:LacI family DNA-binding transcriptional regulator n=1 Tax=Candidatus Haliotispira prima TaxID=3034016 RepID=A0ABY8MEV0_9SPIO|nr:LacI family DNA-binding transcriptional regulator [Candidatus Haliotispira prima]
MVTIKDVARYAETSPATVSRVLRNRSGVRPDIREGVLAAVTKLNYKPLRVHPPKPGVDERVPFPGVHTSVAPIVRAFPKNILFIAPNFSAITWVLPTIMHHLNSELSCEFNLAGMNFQHEFTLEAARQRIKPGHTAAVIFYNIRPDDLTVDYLEEHQVPAVLLGISHPRLKSILTDDRAGIYDAVRHLADRGYSRVFFWGWEPGDFCLQERYEAFRAATKDLGLPCVGERYSSLDLAGGRTLAEELLAQNVMKKTDAIFCAADILALGAYEVFRCRHRTPGIDDFGLIGYDNIYFSQVIGLTTIEQFIPYKLEMASAYLAEVLRRPQYAAEIKEVQIRLSPKLIERTTT